MTISRNPRCFVEDRDAPGKQAILAAALALFVRNGVDGASIRDIARESGYSNPALFKHFESKEALAYALFERAFDWIFGNLPAPTDAAFHDQMREALRAYLALLDEDVEAAMFFQENLRRFWPRLSPAQRRRSLIGHMNALIAIGVRQGAIPASEAQELIVTGILGLLGQFARQFYFGDYGAKATDWMAAIERLVLGMAVAESCRAVDRRPS
ncbi:MAG: TetR/AcrR family transcriptional regulator [Methylocella sp.]